MSEPVSGSGVRPGNRETAAARERVQRYVRAIRWSDVAGNWTAEMAAAKCIELADAEVAASLPVLPETREDEDDGFGPLHGVAAPLSGRRAVSVVEPQPEAKED